MYEIDIPIRQTDVVDSAKLFQKSDGLGVGVAVYFKPTAPNSNYPRSANCHAVDVTGGLFLRPRGPNHTHVIQVVTIDPRISFLPKWLIDWVIVNFAYKVLTRLERHAQNYERGGSLHHRIQAEVSSDVYAEVRRRLLELQNYDPGEAASGNGGADEQPNGAEDAAVDGESLMGLETGWNFNWEGWSSEAVLGEIGAAADRAAEAAVATAESFVGWLNSAESMSGND